MKCFMTFLCLVLFINPMAHAEKVTLASLVDFSKKNKFKDNHISIKTQKEFAAYKGEDPWIQIHAYKGVDQFSQVAILCDECSSQNISKEHLKECVLNFYNLYEHLAGKKYPNNLEEILSSKVSGKDALLNENLDKFKLRLSSSALKCDGIGGERLRIDFFVKE